MNTVYNCIVCECPLSGKQRSFCSIRCKNDYYLSYDVLKARALERKSRLITANGGACRRCGYSASIDALSFYDKDGQSLHIDMNVLANSNYEKLSKKVAESQILCRNCVEEIQNSTELDSWHVSDSEVSLIAQTRRATRNDKWTVGVTNVKFTENLALCGVKAGQTIVLGVSGGVDSITMLDLFANAPLKLNIIVAHMNHGVRPEAKSDETLVSELAQKHGFRYISRTIAKPTSGNLENALRNERRKFLLDTAKKTGATHIALAHNANDQAETFIMNAVRGSGPAGLGAMSMSEDTIIRPLINISRNEIEAYARERQLVWHEDATNQDTSYDRNYVRHRILPLFERLNSEYLGAIHRTTHLQRQIDSHFKEEAYRIIQDPSTEKLRHLDKPLLYEALGLLYEQARGNRQDLSLSHLSKMETLIGSGAGTKELDLPGNITVRRRYDKLDFSPKKEHNIPSTPRTKKLKMGRQHFGNWEITISNTPHSAKGKMQLTIDAAILPQIRVRTRMPGDRIASIGPNGRKKLQDLFVDAKIDRARRSHWPIFTLDSEIIWVPGLAKANFKTTSKTLLTIDIVEVRHETTE